MRRGVTLVSGGRPSRRTKSPLVTISGSWLARPSTRPRKERPNEGKPLAVAKSPGAFLLASGDSADKTGIQSSDQPNLGEHALAAELRVDCAHREVDTAMRKSRSPSQCRSM